MRLSSLNSWMLIGALAGTAACAQEPRTAPVEERAQEAADSAAEAARDAGDRAGAAVETADVKMALSMDEAVDASDINVDTNHTTKVVTLRGSVPTSDQRDRAEAIAKREATDYRVDNQLVVNAR